MRAKKQQAGINAKIRTAPNAPGVYYFKNKKGAILYIGKALNLRARLRSYVAKSGLALKTESLVNEAVSVSWEELSSETAALIRESELIKKLLPKYNILMRDDKQYLYVGITREDFPKIFLTHQPTNTLPYADFIGPFTDAGSVRTVLKSLRKAFPYCSCFRPHKNLCLNARIGRCFGVCCLKEATELSSQLASYQNNIRAIKKILSGKNKSLLAELKKQMRTLSRSQHYEEAGKIRNQLLALERIFAHQPTLKQDVSSDRAKALAQLALLLKLKTTIRRIEGYDISNIHGSFAYGSMVVFVDGLPAKDQYRIFRIKMLANPPMDVRRPFAKTNSDDPAMMHETITRRLHHPEWQFPDVMLIDGGPTQLQAALRATKTSYFSSRRRSPRYNTTIQQEERVDEKRKNLCAGKDARKISDFELPIVVSLAKREEKLYLSPTKAPIKLKESSTSLLNLLTHIRNESHRFAIKHYRKAHRKRGF